MSKIYFSSWRGEIIDNRKKPKEEWSDSAFKFPVDYDSAKPSFAFVGWEGFAIFNEDTDVVRLACEYAYQYQKYSEACGRCTPGRWGGRILYDLLDKIARGEGEMRDIEHLNEVSTSMKMTSKCEIGKTVPMPILEFVKFFFDDFKACIENKKPSKHYHQNKPEYVAKITAPCIDMCPDHVDIPAYIEGVRDLRFDDSLIATRKTMPLAHTCGRVCPHPCENACRRANLDKPISIMELKRIGADFERDHSSEWLHPVEKKPSVGKKVAIIGSGPAGLTAAYYLGMDGIDCDIYEELPVLGGEVMVGVPPYRMPTNEYQKDIDFCKSAGGNYILNTRVTADMLRDFESKYDAILLATGTRISKKIRATNERVDMIGYWSAIEMLDQYNLWERHGIGSKIDLTGKTLVCVGGGFTSMDVVRCAVRCGAKRVVMLYRRDERTIINNTSYEEYHEAVEEGVEFIFQSAIEEIYDVDNKLTKLKINMYAEQPDPNGGRPQLVKVEGADFNIECDFLVPAVSQDADLKYLPQEWALEMTSWNTIKTDGKTYMTSKKGVWAAGDCEYGPMTIVNAVGQAKRAASVMSRYLRTGEISLCDEEIMEDHLKKLKVYNKKEKVSGWLSGLKREVSEKLSVQTRIDNNKEVNQGFTQEEAINEAERCMRCYYIAMVAV